MIVLFEGGGPANGMFHSIADKDELRVATPDMIEEGVAAFYTVERAPLSEFHRAATASFAGIRPSAASLLDVIV